MHVLRERMLRTLLQEQPQYRNMRVPGEEWEQRRLLRALMNIREPMPIDPAFLEMQDTYLHAVTAEKGITALKDLQPVEAGIYLWQGDITTLQCGAIVNAANSGMTGCYHPCHGCIDNAIHTYAGVQLRLECAALMAAQGHPEPTGSAKLTGAYNLPCDHVLHTVGPIVFGALTAQHEKQLADCYRACLKLAQENGIRSVAFCCISTGEFHFPNARAAEIAVETVRAYKQDTEVIFNVFKDRDYEIYRQLLG